MQRDENLRSVRVALGRLKPLEKLLHEIRMQIRVELIQHRNVASIED